MLRTGIWSIPTKSCTYPWSLRLPPVQFTRVMAASLVSAPATRAVYQSVCHIFCACPPAVARLIFKMLVSARATGAVQQIGSRIPGLCTCHPCSLPEFSPTMSWWFNMTLQVSSVMLCWVALTLACPEIVPFALPCFVINLFWCALRLIEQVMRRIPRCQLFSFAKVFLRIWFLQWLVLDINLIRVLHDKTVFLKCSSASKAHWSHDSLHLQPSQSVSECQCVKYRETGH